MSKMFHRLAVWRWLALTLFVLAVPVTASAQTLPLPGSEATNAESEKPADPLGRSTPRGTVQGYLSAVSEENYERAAEYLDLSTFPSSARSARGAVLARQLQQLLDRGGWILATWQLANTAVGQTGDELGVDTDIFGYAPTDAEPHPLTVRRVGRPDATPVWLIDGETLSALPALVRNAAASPLDEVLPASLKNTAVWGAPIGHWLALALIALLALAAARLLTTILAFGLRFAFPMLRVGRAFRVLSSVLLPVGLFLACILFTIATIVFGVSVVARGFAGRAAEILAWVSLAWVLWRVIDGISALWIERMTLKGHVGGVSAVALSRRVVKAFLAVIAIVVALDTLGFDMTTGLAALGIGGLALALGAQKTIENFVGSLTLVVDQPVRAGDFCQFGGILGTVEDIGMRSTRIRTLDRTLVTVPNGEFSAMKIENFTRRDRFWFHHELGLRYEATPDQMRQFLAALRTMLSVDTRLDTESNRVRFLGYGADALRVEIFAYVFARDWNHFLEIQEELALQVMDIVAGSEVAFAFPSRTLYLARDGGADTSLSAALAHHATDQQGGSPGNGRSP